MLTHFLLQQELLILGIILLPDASIIFAFLVITLLGGCTESTFHIYDLVLELLSFFHSLDLITTQAIIFIFGLQETFLKAFLIVNSFIYTFSHPGELTVYFKDLLISMFSLGLCFLTQRALFF